MDIFKENFPNNVINDLYTLCFQNYRASITSWCEGGGGGESAL